MSFNVWIQQQNKRIKHQLNVEKKRLTWKFFGWMNGWMAHSAKNVLALTLISFIILWYSVFIYNFIFVFLGTVVNDFHSILFQISSSENCILFLSLDTQFINSIFHIITKYKYTANMILLNYFSCQTEQTDDIWLLVGIDFSL